MLRSHTRRQFCHSMLHALPAAVLVRMAWVTGAFADEARSPMQRWVVRLHRLCRNLETNKLAAVEWQDQVDSLLSEVPLRDIVRFIDFERLIEGIEYPDDRAATRRVRFPDLPELQARVKWGPKVFALKKARAIVPHAHNNMVSSHLILNGIFHVRTYQRVRDEDGAILLEPSIDRLYTPGEIVTMSDQRDNVHWFVAHSDFAYTFDIPIVDLVPGREYPTPAEHHGMIHVDPAGATTSGGLIRAPVISFETAIQKYGKT